MLADIAHGHTDAADVLFLIGVILFAVAALFEVRSGTLDRGGRVFGSGVLIAVGLAVVAAGWLVQ